MLDTKGLYHPEGFLWGVAVAAAKEQEFQFSIRCESSLKDQIHSGLQVFRVGLFEFRERAGEAKANIERLVDVMVELEKSHDRYADVIQEATLHIALYQHQLCPGLWPLC